jgi:hypothetical protein
MLPSSRKKLRQIFLIVLLIRAHNSVRNRTKVHRCALLTPSQSPWERLYHHGGASSFLQMTGLTRSAFCTLNAAIFDDNIQWPFVRRGRPKLLNSAAQLGLYLFFIGLTMGIKHLCMIFGVVSSVCSFVIN